MFPSMSTYRSNFLKTKALDRKTLCLITTINLSNFIHKMEASSMCKTVVDR